MKVGKHTAFMIDFVSEFTDGERSRFDFELDYSGYVIEYFPFMGKEDRRLARKFVATVDNAVEFAESNKISEDDYSILLNNALCDLLGIDEPDLE